MKPLVSIITTVKNGQNTIEETILSALAQTYSNIELIVVDDGSQDNTLLILQELAIKNHNMKIIPTRGVGRVTALNMAIDNSSGEYVSNLDADDIIHPEKIEIQIKHISDKNNIFLTATDSNIFYKNDRIYWGNISKKYEYSTINSSILFTNTINHSSTLINKAMLQSIGKYNPEQKSQIDYELWLRAFNNDLRMDIIHLPITGKRIHRNQSYENKNRLIYTFRSLKLQLKYIFKKPKYIHYSILVIGIFLLAQLPFSIRRKIRLKLKNKSET